jgi:hypothetical protein
MNQRRFRLLSSLLAAPAAFAIFTLAGNQPTPAGTPIQVGKILCTTSSSPQCGPLAD